MKSLIKHPKRFFSKSSFSKSSFFKLRISYFLVLLILSSAVISTGVFADKTNRVSDGKKNIQSNRSKTMFNKKRFVVSVVRKQLSSLQQQDSQQNLIDSSVIALRRDYEFIFFYSTDCQYCMSFDPVLKQYSDNLGVLVKAFAIGERVSPSFPNSTVVTQEVVDRFFGGGAKLSVPTLFVLNKNNFHAYPVSSGLLTYSELNTRMNQLAPKILTNEGNAGNENVRSVLRSSMQERDERINKTRESYA
jgi:type-F conjugative transfer system pilin assembly thiol-disulfide isomerase TrbB